MCMFMSIRHGKGERRSKIENILATWIHQLNFLGLPSFKVLGSSRSGIPEIKVGLQGGLNHDMVLEPYSRSPCNFIGHLKNVPDSSVAVTGCLEKPGDKMHITMIAPIEAKSSIFELDFDGQVTALENPQKHQTGIDPHLVCYKLLFD